MPTLQTRPQGKMEMQCDLLGSMQICELVSSEEVSEIQRWQKPFFVVLFLPNHFKNVVSQLYIHSTLARFTDTPHYTYRILPLPVAWEAATYAAIISDCWATKELGMSDLLYLPQQEQLWLFAGHSIICSTEKAWINRIIKLQNPHCCSCSAPQTSCSHQKAKGKSQ